MEPTIFTWGVSSYFGWGVNGLNLLLEWPQHGRGSLRSLYPIDRRQVVINPLEEQRLLPAFEQSSDIWRQMEATEGNVIMISCPVVHSAIDDMARDYPTPRGAILRGRINLSIAMPIHTNVSADGRERARLCDAVLAGSRWTEGFLEAAGIKTAGTILQGIDPTYFHPAPRAGRFGGRFAIFSGGKPEFRKGQDLVLAAFRIFAARHKDALLVTAWSSPFPDYAASLGESVIDPPPIKPTGEIDVAAWASAIGLNPAQVVALGPVPNPQMSRVLREMDVALFPNRCESATNLVAMEAMACGVPTILAANTGQLDLIEDGNCMPLRRQRPIPGRGRDGWGESDVEEIVEALEQARADSERTREIGRRGAETLSHLTWARMARQLSAVIDAHTP